MTPEFKNEAKVLQVTFLRRLAALWLSDGFDLRVDSCHHTAGLLAEQRPADKHKAGARARARSGVPRKRRKRAAEMCKRNLQAQERRRCRNVA